MIIHTINQRGEAHRNHNEDAIFTKSIGNLFIGGIFDGCSSGVNSWLASALFARCFRKATNEIQNEGDLLAFSRILFEKSLQYITQLKEEFDFRTDELLTTAILLVFDMENQNASVCVAGDGYFSVNGKKEIIDQNNVPDYLIYHLQDIIENKGFDDWWEAHVYKNDFTKVHDIAICSDGILSFDKRLNPQNISDEQIEPDDFLLNNDWLINNTAMLPRKCNILKNKHGLVHLDDLSIIRLTNY